jgi:hypothetical protein
MLTNTQISGITLREVAYLTTDQLSGMQLSQILYLFNSLFAAPSIGPSAQGMAGAMSGFGASPLSSGSNPSNNSGLSQPLITKPNG